jgi:nitrogen fixation protein NifU and related proteins
MKEIPVSDRLPPTGLHSFVEQLRKEILEVTKRAYGERVFQRWMNPLYEGSLTNPDGYACLRGSCGDSIEVFLRFDGGRVRDASFRTAGCGASAVCGSYAAELALDKGPEEIQKITGKSILERLGGLPREEEPIATLAAETLQAALQDFICKRQLK